ncbi:MAG: glycosyltransferase family 4 protein [Planctomycetales bacterium]|nr:glycosyltransferase family 4 protein [Planctomycetales bacterium]
MKVCLVTTNAPPLVGGLEHLALRIAQKLAPFLQAVWLVARFAESRQTLSGYFLNAETPREFTHENVRVRIVSPSTFYLNTGAMRAAMHFSRRGRTFQLARRIYTQGMFNDLRKACAGADLILYLGTGVEMLGYAASAVAADSGIPFVVEPAIHPGQWGDSPVDLRLYQSANGLLAHSDGEATFLKERGIPASHVTVVKHGVDLEESGNGHRFRTKHGLVGPIVLFLGRKTLDKGVVRAFDAFRLCKTAHSDATLVIAGPSAGKVVTPPCQGVLELDDLTEAEKQDALSAADVLCVPSKGESFGMVYFEAWAYGTAVIGLDLPALRETIGASGGGRLVRDSDTDVAAAMEELLSSSELRKRLGRLGQAFSKSYDWTVAAESYRDALIQFHTRFHLLSSTERCCNSVRETAGSA